MNRLVKNTGIKWTGTEKYQWVMCYTMQGKEEKVNAAVWWKHISG